MAAALKTAFDYAIRFRYDVLVTIDCDGQHEPQRIAPARLPPAVTPTLFRAAATCGIASRPDRAPAERRQINMQITRRAERAVGPHAHRCILWIQSVSRECPAQSFEITEPGYGMPLELWVQAAASRPADRGAAGAADLS